MPYLPLRCSVLLAAVLLCVAANPALAQSDVVGSCKVGCEHALAACEQKLGRKGHCTRKSAACIEQCSAPPKAAPLSKAQKRKTLCEQRCDLNRSTCDRSNPANTQSCEAGRTSCVARCS